MDKWLASLYTSEANNIVVAVYETLWEDGGKRLEHGDPLKAADSLVSFKMKLREIVHLSGSLLAISET